MSAQIRAVWNPRVPDGGLIWAEQLCWNYPAFLCACKRTVNWDKRKYFNIPKKNHPLSTLSEAQAITIQVWGNSVTAPVQGSALFSVDIACIGTPTVRWTFSSESGQQRIAAWVLGGSANVTQMYEGRVQTHPNGSLTISSLRLQDSGYYIITVTDMSGNSKDMGLVLSVTGE